MRSTEWHGVGSLPSLMQPHAILHQRPASPQSHARFKGHCIYSVAAYTGRFCTRTEPNAWPIGVWSGYLALATITSFAALLGLFLLFCWNVMHMWISYNCYSCDRTGRKAMPRRGLIWSSLPAARLLNPELESSTGKDCLSPGVPGVKEKPDWRANLCKLWGSYQAWQGRVGLNTAVKNMWVEHSVAECSKADIVYMKGISCI